MFFFSLDVGGYAIRLFHIRMWRGKKKHRINVPINWIEKSEKEKKFIIKSKFTASLNWFHFNCPIQTWFFSFSCHISKSFFNIVLSCNIQSIWLPTKRREKKSLNIPKFWLMKHWLLLNISYVRYTFPWVNNWLLATCNFCFSSVRRAPCFFLSDFIFSLFYSFQFWWMLDWFGPT